MIRAALTLTLALLCAPAQAYDFACLPNIANNGETGTNLQFSINKGAPSWIRWSCPGGAVQMVVAENWPMDLNQTVAAANTLGWPIIKALAKVLPDAASQPKLAPVLQAASAASK